MPPIVSQSIDSKYDRLLGEVGLCGHAIPGSYQDRCGYMTSTPIANDIALLKGKLC